MLVAAKPDTIQVGTVHVNRVDLAELMLALDRLVNDRGTADYVCFCEAHLCVRGSTCNQVRSYLDTAALVLPDGVSITAGARLLGHHFPERLPGPIVMLEYCRHAVRNGFRHFFYGGGPGVADELASRLRRQFPEIDISGAWCPPFRRLTDAEEAGIKTRIEQSGTDVLWVGLGAPKQEQWMFEHSKTLNVPLMLGVGAAFDFHSGNRKWAPAFVRRVGAEWIFRSFTGGRRVFVRNLHYTSRFVWLLGRQFCRERILRKESLRQSLPA